MQKPEITKTDMSLETDKLKNYLDLIHDLLSYNRNFPTIGNIQMFPDELRSQLCWLVCDWQAIAHQLDAQQ